MAQATGTGSQIRNRFAGSGVAPTPVHLSLKWPEAFVPPGKNASDLRLPTCLAEDSVPGQATTFCILFAAHQADKPNPRDPENFLREAIKQRFLDQRANELDGFANARLVEVNGDGLPLPPHLKGVSTGSHLREAIVFCAEPEKYFHWAEDRGVEKRSCTDGYVPFEVLKFDEFGGPTCSFTSSEEAFLLREAAFEAGLNQVVSITDPDQLSRLIGFVGENGQLVHRFRAGQLHDPVVIDEGSFLVGTYQSAGDLRKLAPPSAEAPVTVTFRVRDAVSALHAGLQLGVLDAVFPLHLAEEREAVLKSWLPRSLFGLFFIFMPIGGQPWQAIVEYYGQRLAYYFLFLAHYLNWLRIPAVFAAFVLAASHYEIPYEDVILKSWHVVGTAMWTTLFVESWKRSKPRLDEEYGPPAGSDDNLVLGDPNPEGQMLPEDYFPSRGIKNPKAYVIQKHRAVLPAVALPPVKVPSFVYLRRFVSCMVFVVAGGFIALIITVLLQIGDKAMEEYPDSVVLSNAPVLLYLVVTYFLEGGFNWLAVLMTDFERHLIVEERKKSVVVKKCVFAIANNTGYFFYLIFWVGDVATLRTQLVMFLLVKQLVLQNFMEAGLPRLQTLWSNARVQSKVLAEESLHPKLEKQGPESQRLEKDLCAAIAAEAALPDIDLFDDYLEIATQFAVTVSFSGLCPEVAVLAVLHLAAEIYTDAFKFCRITRRTVIRAADLEIWMSIIEAIAFGGTVASMFMLHIANPEFPLWMVLVVEHAVVVVKSYLGWSIADIPEDVTARKIRNSMSEQSKRLRKRAEAAESAFAAAQRWRKIANLKDVAQAFFTTPDEAGEGRRKRDNCVTM
mmetsp:Transcript_13941/g.33744  ORF Transcript_13941/g.33744 Transcript_13941/m.33744 type:complete len:842 (+) Transcript_13941:15-2540(+)